MYCRYSGENSQRHLEEFRTRRTELTNRGEGGQERKRRHREQRRPREKTKRVESKESQENKEEAKREEREQRSRIAEPPGYIGIRNWEKGSKAGELGAGWEVLRGPSGRGRVSLAASELWNANRHHS